MRNLLILFAFVCMFSGSIQSQQLSDSIRRELFSMTICPFVGVASSGYSKDFYWDDVYKNSAPCFSGGIMCGIEMKEPHGALIVNIGIQSDYNNYLNDRINQRFVEHYTGIPLLIGYRYDLSEKMSMALHIGALPRMMVDYSIDHDNSISNLHWEESLFKWHTSLKTGMDISFKISRQLCIRATADLVWIDLILQNHYNALPLVLGAKLGVLYRFTH